MNIPYPELVKGVKETPKQFLSKIALKRSVTYTNTDPHQLPRRTIIALATLLVGNWKVTFQGDEGSKTYYFLIFPLLLLELVWEAISLPGVRARHERLLQQLNPLASSEKPKVLTRTHGNLLYLRTDMLGQTRDGGSFTHVAGFIAGAQQNGWNTTLVSCGKLHSVAHIERIIRYSPWINFNVEAGEMDYSRRLTQQLLTMEKIDCIYQRHSGYNLTGLELAKHWNVPFILEVNNLETWIRDNWGTQKSSKLLEETERTLFSRADLIVVVSDVLKDDLVKFGVQAEKILVNPNGVEEDIFTPVVTGSDEIRKRYGFETADVVTGFIGSFGVWHGVPVLAEAIPLVQKEAGNCKFLLIGDGELRTQIENKLSKQLEDGSVVFTGRVSHHDAPRYLAASDIFASPHVQNADGTRFFGSPTKLFEYMAMERAIVASDLEQIGEILKDDEDAVLTPPGDATALAKAIMALSKDAPKRQRLAKAARIKALKQYTWRANVSRAFGALQKKG